MRREENENKGHSSETHRCACACRDDEKMASLSFSSGDEFLSFKDFTRKLIIQQMSIQYNTQYKCPTVDQIKNDLTPFRAAFSSESQHVTVSSTITEIVIVPRKSNTATAEEKYMMVRDVTRKFDALLPM
ncbi:hypothetical protein RRG08_053816 [Elysia crispata]|uniref:Uncharacterized protein n=1 Tax=Elysia crispata TaxID=231223 RepID=A0AAE1CMS1_9GAST|nr:hypothetical protein RRG08_053816 [Elysia crispata]